MGKAPMFDDLRRVGALKRDRLDRKPSDNALAQQAGVSRDTVGAWLRGERLPQDLKALLKVLALVQVEATRRKIMDTPCDGVAGQTVADLLNEGRWRAEYDAERKRRAQEDQEAAERKQAQAAMERDRQAALLLDLPRPVRSWTPQRLGVHPAIPGHPTGPEGAGFVLPLYVPRAHDIELRERVAAAVDGASPLLAVVRCGSCTGKTRTAFETLTVAVPDDFELLFPTNADNLLTVLKEGALSPRTVLWLNEAQDYLSGPTGEAAAAALLRRLDTDGPLIVLATLWPDHDEKLTTTPAPGEPDPHRHARVLLAQAYRAYVPRSFADDLDAVRRVAGHDQSLAAALETGSADLTQVLAAGPDLVTHYEHPTGAHGVYGRALISAAMDATRLGVTGPLPLAFLQSAAPGYLTDPERAAADPDWFTGALAYARTLIKQTTKPLQDVPNPSGMGAVPGVVRLADYLQQHGRQSRMTECPPAAFWDAALEHLKTPGDLTQLAEAAHERLRYRHTAELYCAAANAGAPYAVGMLAWLREMAGDKKGAERLAQRAADAGAFHALLALALLREMAGDKKGAERLPRTAGDVERLAEVRKAADSLQSQKDPELLAWLPEAYPEGPEWLAGHLIGTKSTAALITLAWLCDKSGEQEGVKPFVWQAADAGVHAQEMLDVLRKMVGNNEEEAERLVLLAINAGLPHALLATFWLDLISDQRERQRRVMRAVGVGIPAGLLVLARLRNESEEAYLRYGLEADGTLAKPWAQPEPGIGACYSEVRS
ncbi:MULTISPECIES: sel1 repeat family protein [unclassified Streptomyces]|uniref:sel1 repeat family protein n=1 Tax=unclassified Streptomyces TaxID=2593676 RepID=UPI0036FF2FB9